MTPEKTAVWSKSSRSGGTGGNCVELSSFGAMRDSKNPTGPTLTVDLDGFLTAVKGGRFDR